jgi:hypothetical protein
MLLRELSKLGTSGNSATSPFDINLVTVGVHYRNKIINKTDVIPSMEALYQQIQVASKVNIQVIYFLSTFYLH